MADVDKANVNEIVHEAMLGKLGPQGYELVSGVIDKTNQQLQKIDKRDYVIPNKSNSNTP